MNNCSVFCNVVGSIANVGSRLVNNLAAGFNYEACGCWSGVAASAAIGVDNEVIFV